MACAQPQPLTVNDVPMGMHSQEPSMDADKLSYAIFSILESNFLFGYDSPSLRKPEELTVAVEHPPPPIKENDAAVKNRRRSKVFILSIDAAGMRGIIPGKALEYLENALKKKSGNPSAKIADYFDVVAGTGVGGIFAAMLLTPNGGAAADTWRLLETEGDKLYGKKRDSKGGFLKRAFKFQKSGTNASLEKVMKKALTEEKTGRRFTLKDTLKPVLIPCYDLASAAPFLFSRADAFESNSFDFNLWEVCLVTAAEPGVFDPISMKSVDGETRCLGIAGGVAMSNPTAAAITHVLHNKKEFPMVRGVEDICVLSLGGGGPSLEGSFEYEKVKKWKAKEWARPLARISGDSSTELVDHAVAMAFGHNHGTNYVRIQLGAMRVGFELDPNPSNVKMLIEMGEEMLKQKNVESVLLGGRRIGEESNAEKLEWFAEQLVEEQGRRIGAPK